MILLFNKIFMIIKIFRLLNFNRERNLLLKNPIFKSINQVSKSTNYEAYLANIYCRLQALQSVVSRVNYYYIMCSSTYILISSHYSSNYFYIKNKLVKKQTKYQVKWQILSLNHSRNHWHPKLMSSLSLLIFHFNKIFKNKNKDSLSKYC